MCAFWAMPMPPGVTIDPVVLLVELVVSVVFNVPLTSIFPVTSKLSVGVALLIPTRLVDAEGFTLTAGVFVAFDLKSSVPIPICSITLSLSSTSIVIVLVLPISIPLLSLIRNATFTVCVPASALFLTKLVPGTGRLSIIRSVSYTHLRAHET